MSTDPKLSVIIPALNEEQCIQQLLDSFRRQTRNDFEVIIVDNGSSDKTLGIVSEEIKKGFFQLRLLEEPQIGIGYTRKRGMDKAAKCGTPYLAGTDADTIVPSEWVASIMKTFEETDADLLLGAKALLWSAKAEYIPSIRYLKETWSIYEEIFKVFGNKPRGVNFAVTNSMYKKVGGMPQPMNDQGRPIGGEDVQFAKQIEEAGGLIENLKMNVITSPRRYLQALIENTPDHFSLNGVTEVRDEELLYKKLRLIDESVVVSFVEEINKRGFNEYIVKNRATRLWSLAAQFIDPYQNEFLVDSDQLPLDDLYKKYSELFKKRARSGLY